MAWLLASVVLVSLFSLTLEIAQSCQAGRVSSAIDWATNSAGAVLGAALALLLPMLARAVEPSPVTRTRDSAVGARLRVGAMTVIALWVLSQTMPWSFSADVGTWRRNLAFLRHWQDAMPLDGWNVLRHLGAWLAIAAACRLATASRLVAAASLLIATASCLALQVMLEAPRPLSVDELLAIAVAVVVSAPALALLPEPSAMTGGRGCC